MTKNASIYCLSFRAHWRTRFSQRDSKMFTFRRGTVSVVFLQVFILGRVSTADGSFICPSLGFFPHPTDPSSFYRCLKVNVTAFKYTCPPYDPVFNATTKQCVNPTKQGNSLVALPLSASPIQSPSGAVPTPSSEHSTSTLYHSHSNTITAESKEWSAMTSASRFEVPPFTNTRKPISSAIQAVSSLTVRPEINSSDWSVCRSMSLEEMLTCFKTRARNVKERLQKATLSTDSTRKILESTTHHAEDVLQAFGTNKDLKNEFNAFQVIAILEDIWRGILKHATNSNETIRIFSKYIAVESVNVDGQYKFPNYSLGFFKKKPWNQESDYLLLPKKLLSDEKYPCRSISVLYLNLHTMVPTRMLGTNSSLKINSHVISMLLCVPVKNTAEQIIIVLKNLKPLDDNDYTYCAFWDFSISTTKGQGMWSRKGCHVVSERSNGTHTVCKCSHLTNFAVLMGSADSSVSNANQFALSVITYVGCVLSLFGAVGAIASFVMFTNLNTDRHIIHGNLLMAIAISQTIFLAGIGKTENAGQCKFTAIMLHYFYLVSFGWMLCEGLHLYTMVVKVFNISSKIYHYIVFAWGIPALIVLIAAVCRYPDYGTKTSCWISPERNTLLAFVIPVAVTLFANIVILAMVLNEICRLQTSQRACMGNIAIPTLRSLVVLVPLLGVTWLFGLLLFATHNIVFQYLFALFNTLQGFFIFLLHCLFNSEIRKNFKRKKEAWKSTKAFHYLRKRFSASSVAPSIPQNSLSEKAATFKATSR